MDTELPPNTDMEVQEFPAITGDLYLVTQRDMLEAWRKEEEERKERERIRYYEELFVRRSIILRDTRGRRNEFRRIYEAETPKKEKHDWKEDGF